MLTNVYTETLFIFEDFRTLRTPPSRFSVLRSDMIKPCVLGGKRLGRCWADLHEAYIWRQILPQM